MVWLSQGDSRSLGGSVTEGYVSRIVCRVNGRHPGRATLSSGRKSPSVFIVVIIISFMLSLS